MLNFRVYTCKVSWNCCNAYVIRDTGTAQFVELNNWVRYFALLISESRNLAVRNDTELLQWNVVSGKLRFTRTSFYRLINNACRASTFQQCKLFFLFFLFSPFFRRLFWKQCAQRVKFTSSDRIKVSFLIFVIFSSSKRSTKKKKKRKNHRLRMNI